MVRVLHLGNYGIYVLDERGGRHHLPHAHIKNRDRRVASVFLLTLTYYDVVERVPVAVMDAIRGDQAMLLERWEELNGDA